MKTLSLFIAISLPAACQSSVYNVFTNRMDYVGSSLSHFSQDGTTGQLVSDRSISTPPCSLTFSATPTFDLANCNTIEFGALTANVTSSSISHLKAGMEGAIVFTQDATGGRTVVFPAAFSETCTVSGTASVTTIVKFRVKADGTTPQVYDCPTNEAGVTIAGSTRTAPGTPAATTGICFLDSTSTVMKCKDTSGNLFTVTKTAGARTSSQYVTYIDSSGVAQLAQPALSEISGTYVPARSGTYASLPACSSANSGQIYYATDSVYSFRCDGSSAWEAYFRGQSVTLPGLVASWTTLTSGTTITVADQTGSISLKTTSTTARLGGVSKAASGDFTKTIVILPNIVAASGSSSDGCGLAVTDGTAMNAGKQVFFGITNNSTSRQYVSVYAYLSGAYSSSLAGNVMAPTGGPLWLRVNEASGTRTFSISTDGTIFNTVYSGAATNPTTANYAFVCDGVISGDSNAATMIDAH